MPELLEANATDDALQPCRSFQGEIQPSLFEVRPEREGYVLIPLVGTISA